MYQSHTVLGYFGIEYTSWGYKPLGGSVVCKNHPKSLFLAFKKIIKHDWSIKTLTPVKMYRCVFFTCGSS